MLSHRLVAAALVVGVLLAVSASAEPAWRALGPDGGSVRGVVFDPADPGVVYAVTEGRLFQSLDAGAHWQPSDPPDGVCQRLLIAPGRPAASTVYCATAGALWRTLDRAHSWELVNATPSWAKAPGLLVFDLARRPGRAA